MGKKARSKLTYANVMSTMAVFIALGGTSFAALTITGKNVPKDALTGKDIKNLTGRDVKNNSLTGADVKNLTGGDVSNGSLLAEDFASGQLPAGERGPQGPPGAGFTGTAAGGDLTGTYPNPQIGTGSIVAADIASNAVGADELGTVHEHFGPLTNITDATAHDGSYATSTATVSCGAGEDMLSVTVDWTSNGGHNERNFGGVLSTDRGDPDSATVEVNYDGGATTASYQPVAYCLF